MSINLRSVFRLVRAANGGVLEREFGRIVRLSSNTSEMIGPHDAASEAGLRGLAPPSQFASGRGMTLKRGPL